MEMSDLQKEFAYATECQLATLENCSLYKKYSQSDKHRHQMIAKRMLTVCEGFAENLSENKQIYLSDGKIGYFGRVKAYLKAGEYKTWV